MEKDLAELYKVRDCLDNIDQCYDEIRNIHSKIGDHRKNVDKQIKASKLKVDRKTPWMKFLKIFLKGVFAIGFSALLIWLLWAISDKGKVNVRPALKEGKFLFINLLSLYNISAKAFAVAGILLSLPFVIENSLNSDFATQKLIKNKKVRNIYLIAAIGLAVLALAINLSVTLIKGVSFWVTVMMLLLCAVVFGLSFAVKLVFEPFMGKHIESAEKDDKDRLEGKIESVRLENGYYDLADFKAEVEKCEKKLNKYEAELAGYTVLADKDKNSATVKFVITQLEGKRARDVYEALRTLDDKKEAESAHVLAEAESDAEKRKDQQRAWDDLHELFKQNKNA